YCCVSTKRRPALRALRTQKRSTKPCASVGSTVKSCRLIAFLGFRNSLQGDPEANGRRKIDNMRNALPSPVKWQALVTRRYKPRKLTVGGTQPTIHRRQQSYPTNFSSYSRETGKRAPCMRRSTKRISTP